MPASQKPTVASPLDLQRDALITASVEEEQIYSDLASGKKDDRSGLEDCLKGIA